MAASADREIVNDYVRLAEKHAMTVLLDRILKEMSVTPDYAEMRLKTEQMRDEVGAQK